jgi:hypothetical protein
MNNFLKEIIDRNFEYKSLLGSHKRFSIPNLREFEVKRYYNLEKLPSLRLPYPKICIEYEDLMDGSKKEKFAIFLYESYVEEYECYVIAVAPMFTLDDHWYLLTPYKVLGAYWYQEILENGGYSFVLKFDEKDPRRTSVENNDQSNSIYFLKSLYNFLNLYYEKGTKITSINKRKSLGLSFKSYDEYRTLELDKPAKTYIKRHLGGTHASPREHERSGHWRKQRIKDGFKTIFIEQTTINKNIGAKLNKDYKINPHTPDT